MVVLAKLSFSIPLLDVENLETINGRNPLNLRCLHTANISVSSKSHYFYLLDQGDLLFIDIPMDLQLNATKTAEKPFY